MTNQWQAIKEASRESKFLKPQITEKFLIIKLINLDINCN